MITNYTTEEVRKLFTIPSDASKTDVEARFKEVADVLLHHAYICRGETKFTIDEIEFYFYNGNHPDLITYPRNTDALQWYRNAFFGVDITFASHVKTTTVKDKKKEYECFCIREEDSAFGGVLIRKLTDTSTGKKIDGPRMCANALFGTLDATSVDPDYPLLKFTKESHGEKKDPLARLNIVTDKERKDRSLRARRVERIVYNNYIYEDVDDALVTDFEHYMDEKYRYFVR